MNIYINYTVIVLTALIALAGVWIVYKKTELNVNKAVYLGGISAALLFTNIIIVVKAVILYFAVMYNIILFLLYLLCIWDIKEKQIPVLNIYILFFACSVMTLLNPYCSIVNNVITGGIISLFLFIVYKTNKVGIGLGDVEVIGALAFAFGYPQIFSILIMGLFLSMLVGIGLIILKKASIKTEVAFIPFLFIGYILNILNF